MKCKGLGETIGQAHSQLDGRAEDQTVQLVCLQLGRSPKQ